MKLIRFLLYILFCLFLSSFFGEILVRYYFQKNNLNINSFRPSFYFADKMISDKTRFKSHPFLPFLSRPFDKRVVHIYKPAINKVITYSYQNNSLGFRTPERPFSKPAGTKRIIALGGSTTWDGPTNDLTWPAIIKRKLNDYYREKNIKIEVINLGVDAGVSYMSLAILNLFGVHFEPDLVISYDGVNDLVPAVYWKNIVPDYSNYIKPFRDNVFSAQVLLPKWMFNSYLITFSTYSFDKLIGLSPYLPDQIWRKSATVTDKTVESGLQLFFRNLKLMRATCLEYNCKFVASLPHWITIDDNAKYFDENTRNFFQRENFNFLDTESIIPHDDYSLHVDSVHWTEKGLQLLADEWLKKITSEDLLSIESSSASMIKKPK